MNATLDIAVIAVYVAILVTSLDALSNAGKIPEKPRRNWAIAFSGSLIIQALVFIYMQIKWINAPYYDDIIPSAMTWGWILYNWLSGITLLIASKGLGVFVSWDRR